MCSHMQVGEEAGGVGRTQHTWEQLHKGSPRPHTAPSDIKTFWAKTNYFVSETRNEFSLVLIIDQFYNNAPILNFSCSLSFLLRANASPKNSDGHFSTICKGSAYLTPSLSECIRCPPPPQFSARTQPLGRTYKAFALWWKIWPWYIKLWRRTGFTKGSIQDIHWGAIAPHLVCPRSGQTEQLLRSRSTNCSFLDPCRVFSPRPSQMQG